MQKYGKTGNRQIKIEKILLMPAKYASIIRVYDRTKLILCKYLELFIKSVMNEGTDFLAIQYLLQVAKDVHVKNIDGQVVLHAHGCGGNVHYL